MHCRERHSKPGWFLYIPDSAKLTEADIDAFVCCLVPVVRMAVFSKTGTVEAALTLHSLALVRPETVLPDLLNRWGSVALCVSLCFVTVRIHQFTHGRSNMKNIFIKYLHRDKIVASDPYGNLETCSQSECH